MNYKLIKFTSSALLLMSAYLPASVHAAEDNAIPVKISIAPTTINSTVPQSVMLNVSKNTTTAAVADNYSVQNLASVGNILISKVSAAPKNSWNIVSKATDFTTLSKNAKQLYLGICLGTDSMHSLNTEYQPSDNKVKPNSQLSVRFEGATGLVTEAVNAQSVTDLTFTIKQEVSRGAVVKSKDIGKVAGQVTATLYENKDLVIAGAGVLKDGVQISDISGNTVVENVIVEKGVKAAVDSSNLFSGVAAKHMDLINIDTSDTEDFSYMFNQCDTLESLKLNFNTDKATTTQAMFSLCTNLKSLDFKTLNTGNVTWMNEMFQGCNSLETLLIDQIDIKSAMTFRSIFQNCNALNTTINFVNVPNTSMGTTNLVMNAFTGTSTKTGSQTIVNYTADNTIIDDILATKDGNVVKGNIISAK